MNFGDKFKPKHNRILFKRKEKNFLQKPEEHLLQEKKKKTLNFTKRLLYDFHLPCYSFHSPDQCSLDVDNQRSLVPEEQ
jgi:hypothetical protein